MLNFDAVIFDLDGVITQTALVHGSSWKRMFDEYLKSREERFDEPFKEFTHAGDYLPYVDGKPRYKGVDDFLKSRNIELPFGDPSDDPEKETVCALGNRKNLLFNKVLDEEGVTVYPSTVALIKELKEKDVRIGVASSSKNCKPVLEAAELLHYFETRIDGVVSAEIGLNGKPEPDIFTTACDRLGVEYSRAIVVEDAVSGVQAGRKGNFGLTIGIAREDNIRELQVGGADIVVEDMEELTMDDLNNWFAEGIEEDSWKLRFFDYVTEKERSREALLTVGNGYFGTRGALEESSANDVNYPGTYMPGLFNTLPSKVGDRDIYNEDFVNGINWIGMKFRIDGGPWFTFSPDASFSVLKIERTLDMRRGVLIRELIVKDEKGQETAIRSERFAGMHDPHIASLSYEITPLNYSGKIELESSLSGDHINAGVSRYGSLNQEHLKPKSQKVNNDQMMLEVETTQSGTLLAGVSRNRLLGAASNGVNVESMSDPARVAQCFHLEAKEGESIQFEKVTALFSTLKNDSTEPLLDAAKLIGDCGSHAEELEKSAEAWEEIWELMDIHIDGDRMAQRLIHLHIYHMIATASEHHAKLDSGIPPRGLHGEAYRGHIFWDELYILPLYNISYPEVSRSVLQYRFDRLDAARKYAKEYGYDGAMFPWQSGSDGSEQTQILHLNPLSGEWGDDYSSLQRHVSLAIAYNLWNYHHATLDDTFMEESGLELFFDICKFWVSKTREGADGRYHIDKVMGPDEFHEMLPGSSEGGLTDNAYTNIMVSWMLERAAELAKRFEGDRLKAAYSKLNLAAEDIEHWQEVKTKLNLNIDSNGVIEHFDGYFGLKELDWDAYREKYGNIYRLDRILKAEGKSPDDYKLSKQADLLMVFYNLGKEETTRIINGMGYDVPEDYLTKNFDYYIARTSHGSTLSRLVHARLAFKEGLSDVAWSLYRDALGSDLNDIQGGTTGEGIHCGVMAGTVYDSLVSFAGLDLSGEVPAIDPALPEGWKSMRFSFIFRGSRYDVTISLSEIKINLSDPEKTKLKLHICGNEVELDRDETFRYAYN